MASLNPFKRETPIDFLSPQVLDELDRRPPSNETGCLRIVGLLGLFVAVLAVLGFVIITIINGQQPTQTTVQQITSVPTNTLFPTETFTPTIAATNTLDSWSLTGTAILFITATATPTATATMDYCWFLTPSPTLTPYGRPVTPDAWGATGTAIYLQTGTPTATPTASQQPPRAWCDLQLPSEITAEVTDEPPDALYLESPTLAPTNTRTPLPALPPITINTQAPPPAAPPAAQPTAVPPMAIATTEQPVSTMIVIVTATFVPTAESTEEPSATATPTETPTQTPTDLPSPTPTETHSETPTLTPTETPSLTPTETPTLTPTETPSITPTFTATAPPLLAIINSTCANGYPSFAVQNFGEALQYAVWEIRLGDAVAASGVWQYPLDLARGSFANASAPAWIGVGGVYQLNIYQPWDVATPVLSAWVVCSFPTATLTSTETPTETATP